MLKNQASTSRFHYIAVIHAPVPCELDFLGKQYGGIVYILAEGTLILFLAVLAKSAYIHA
jgi:hypothetical protein